MPGLYKFDFYIRDWITGTRGLSAKARGVYIDLLAIMYDHGGPIRNDERWLCRLLGFRDGRQLRPALAELTDAGKIEIVDGLISNARVEHELEVYRERSEKGGKGGRAKAKINKIASGDKVQTAFRSRSGRDLEGSRYAVKEADIGENQPLDVCQSPSPSPSPSRKPPVSPPLAPDGESPPRREYAFEGAVIRLTDVNFERWRTTYHTIPDLRAELASIDDWCARTWDEKKRKRWFPAVAGMLNKRHQENLGRQAIREKDPAADYWRDLEQGVIH